MDPLPDFEFLVISCIFEDLSTLATRAELTLAAYHPSKWSVERGPLDTSRIYSGRPQAGAAEPTRFALWSPVNNPGLSAFYFNNSDGWSTLLRRMSLGGMADCVCVRSTSGQAPWAFQELEYLATGASERRFIKLADEDDGPEFFQDGAPFDFELGSPATNKGNWSRGSLLDFARKLGVDLCSADFWKSSREAFYLFEQRV